MIGTSFKELVFIRATVFLLHYFAPILIVCLILTLIIDHNAHRVTLLLEILSIAEVTFYVLVYIPKSRSLQKPARYPPLATREERRKLFLKENETVADIERYLSKWFLQAPLSEIKRENVKEFFAWAFLNKSSWGPDEEEELDEYADKVEELLARKLQPGRGHATPLRLTIDAVNMLHRPLIWYIIVALVDSITYLYMQFAGFQFYRLRLSRFLTVFPFRMLTLSSMRTTPSNTLSYWYLPHTSKTRRPILFIHGIGIGLYPYVNFLKAINKAQRMSDPTGGQIGILAIELMPISFRITGEMPSQDQLCSEILSILNKHGWDSFALMSHSYGSVITTHMLKNATLAPRISSVVLADPVTILLHHPDVAYNFTRRPPKQANEHQLYYIACTDMCVAHTLGRHFFWAENILFKEDLKDLNATVILSGRDLIVDTAAVGRYLTEDEDGGGYERFLAEGEGLDRAEEGDFRERSWKGEGLDVLWFERCDHAQVFDHRRDYGRIVDVVRVYSGQTE